MLFAKKKNLKFEEMEHIESPNLSELEATLDFLKKTPEKKDNEDNGAVLHPMPAIEPPRLDDDKNTVETETGKGDAKLSSGQDIAFDEETSAEKFSDADKEPETDISEEIKKKAEALKEKQFLNDTVNTEAELALKKDEANITKTSDEVNNAPQKEISDAVKAAMALQAEYEAKKKDQPEEDLRKRSRFMRNRAYPVKKTAAPVTEQDEKVQVVDGKEADDQAEIGTDKKENDQTGLDNKGSVADKSSEIFDEKEGKSDTVTAVSENEIAPQDETKTAVNDADTDTAEDSVETADDRTEKVENDENNASDDDKEAVEKITNNESTDGTQNVKNEEPEPDNVNVGSDDVQKETIVRVTDTADETVKEKKPSPMGKGSSTAITSNLKLPNDVIVSNIESSARSMGKYVGAAKIANPLPHPKKHITRNMDFDYPVSAAQMHFDIEDLNGMDFFDIDD